MTLPELLKLVDAGFTRDDIVKMMTGQPEQETGEKSDNGAKEPAADKKASDGVKDIDALRKEVAALKTAVQTGNIERSDAGERSARTPVDVLNGLMGRSGNNGE